MTEQPTKVIKYKRARMVLATIWILAVAGFVILAATMMISFTTAMLP